MAWPVIAGLVLSAVGQAMGAGKEAQAGAQARVKDMMNNVKANGGFMPTLAASKAALEQSMAREAGGGPSVAEALASSSGAPIQQQSPPPDQMMPIPPTNERAGVPASLDPNPTFTQPSATGSKLIAGVKENMPKSVGPNYQPGSVSEDMPAAGTSMMDKVGTGAAIGSTLYEMFKGRQMPPPSLPGGGRWGGQPSVSQMFMTRR